MTLQVYRIDRSLIGKVGHFFKKPDLPVKSAILSFNAVLRPLSRVYADVTTRNCYILHNEDEIQRFRNPLGEKLLDDVYYIRHPKNSRTDWLIPASRFHGFILREQVADIVSYVRANASVKRLRVSIESGEAANTNLKAIIENLPVEGSASIKGVSGHDVIIECHAPLKASEKRRDYVWLEDFSSTVTAIDNMDDGTVEINERYDLSFGLNIKVAKLAGVSGDWMKSYRYHVSAELC